MWMVTVQWWNLSYRDNNRCPLHLFLTKFTKTIASNPQRAVTDPSWNVLFSVVTKDYQWGNHQPLGLRDWDFSNWFQIDCQQPPATNCNQLGITFFASGMVAVGSMVVRWLAPPWKFSVWSLHVLPCVFVDFHRVLCHPPTDQRHAVIGVRLSGD